MHFCFYHLGFFNRLEGEKRTGMAEIELFDPTYRSYGLATVRYPVLEVTATVEPFENGRGFSLRVLRAGKPRSRSIGALCLAKVPHSSQHRFR